MGEVKKKKRRSGIFIVSGQYRLDIWKGLEVVDMTESESSEHGFSSSILDWLKSVNFSDRWGQNNDPRAWMFISVLVNESPLSHFGNAFEMEEQVRVSMWLRSLAWSNMTPKLLKPRRTSVQRDPGDLATLVKERLSDPLLNLSTRK